MQPDRGVPTSEDDSRSTVVVGVDGSDSSLTAVTWGARVARRTGRELVICHVAGPEPAGGRFESPRSGAEIVASARTLAHRVESPLRTRAVVLEGQPTDRLCELTGTRDLLVLGAIGAGRLPHAPVGSVPIQAAEHSRCPVVVVRRPGSGRGGLPVVVGVDGSEPNEPALRYAVSLARAIDTPLLAVHACARVADSVPSGADGSGRSNGPDRVREQLASAGGLSPSTPLEQEFIYGPAARTLTEASRRAALVVVGARGGGGFSALRLGSVGLHLLMLAHCPVTIVP